MTKYTQALERFKKVFKKEVTRGEIKISNERDRWKFYFAFLISRVLGPLPLICLLWLVTAVKSGIGFWKALWVYPLIFILSVGIPVAITTYLVTSKKVSDIEWSHLEDRKRLVPLVIFSLSIQLLLTKLLTNSTLFHLNLLLAAIILSAVAISAALQFKISGHVIIASITFAGINLFFHQNFLWLFLLLIPIAWARYTLKVHTLSELLGGLILSNGLIILAVLIFGLPNIP